jgi:HEPN domain-containing protein
MSNDRRCRGLLRAARQILAEARATRAAGVHYRAVRQAQEAAELGLKAALGSHPVLRRGDRGRRILGGQRLADGRVARLGAPPGGPIG